MSPRSPMQALHSGRLSREELRFQVNDHLVHLGALVRVDEVRKQDLLVSFVHCETNGGRYQDAPLVYPKAMAARARRGYWLGEPDPPGRYVDSCEPFTFSHFATGESWSTRTGGRFP